MWISLKLLKHSSRLINYTAHGHSPPLQGACFHLFQYRLAIALVDFPQMNGILFSIITDADHTTLKYNMEILFIW